MVKDAKQTRFFFVVQTTFSKFSAEISVRFFIIANFNFRNLAQNRYDIGIFTSSDQCSEIENFNNIQTNNIEKYAGGKLQYVDLQFYIYVLWKKTCKFNQT